MIELVLVVVVIGILAGTTMIAWTGWRQNAAKGEVKSDLLTAASAMENAKNFGNGYPGGIPATFQKSNNVTMIGGSMDGSTFCLQGSSTKMPSVMYYVDGPSKSPVAGRCPSLGVAGWWPMNGDASDLSGTGNDGTTNGVSLTNGEDGLQNSAYSFSGSGSYIDGGTSTSLAFTDNFTLSAWINPTGYHTAGYYGLKNGIIARGPASTYNYALQATNNTTISFIKRTGAESLVFYNFSGLTDLTNTWTLVTVTVKSSTLTLYINGTVAGTATVGSIAGASGDRLIIGSDTTNQTETMFIGSIDDVRIYSRALSGSEAAGLYASGAQ